ncbi:MAG: hypothetical protein FWF24_07095 [Alphaproteobacteria bacterium]|nr:hypothetical protein [Alphaproteobacteria bacterium]
MNGLKIILAGAALLALTAGAAMATPQLKTSLSTQGVYDSNPLMRHVNPQELWGSKTSLRLGFEQDMPTSSYNIAGWVDNNLYDRGRFNSVDFGGEGRLALRTQRLETALALKAVHDTTLTREISDVGLAPDKAIRRTVFEGGPEIRYALSERGSLGLEANARVARYDGTYFTDYHTISAAPSYAYSFSERVTGLLGARWRRYESDEGPDHRVDSAGPFVGVRSALTERLHFQARYGHEASRHKVAGLPDRAWKWNYVFASDLSYKSEQSEVKLGGMRAQQSYANGQDSLLTTVFAEGRHRFDPYFSVRGFLRYQFSDAGDTVLGDVDRVYAGRLGLFYHVTKTVDLTASYSYRNEKLRGAPQTAQRHAVFLGLAWQPEVDL